MTVRRNATSEDSEHSPDQKKASNPSTDRISRRRMLSTAGKVAIGVAAGAIMAGGATYFATRPSVTLPPSVATTTETATYSTVGVSTAKPIDVWWVTNFFAEEQLATLEVANAYTAKTGTPVNITFYDQDSSTAKILAQAPVGVVPDIMSDTGTGIGTRLALNGYVEDVSEIVNYMKAQPDFAPACADLVNTWDLKNKKQSYYQVPFATQAFNSMAHADLIKQYTGVDITPTGPGQFANMPTDWDSWWGLFKKAQDNGGKRDGRNACAYTISNNNDGEDVMTTTVQAFGGQGLDANGKINWNDPSFKKAVTDASAFSIDLYKKGYIPSGAVSWDGAGNNVAMESKKCIMLYSNGSMSIPVWFKNNAPDMYNKTAFSIDYPLGPNGNAWKSTIIIGDSVFVMKDGRNTEGAKDFIDFFIRSDLFSKWFAGYQYRYMPPFKSMMTPAKSGFPGPDDHVIGPYANWYDKAVADYRYSNSAWTDMSYGKFFFTSIVLDVLTKGLSLEDAVNTHFTDLEAYAKQTGL